MVVVWAWFVSGLVVVGSWFGRGSGVVWLWCVRAFGCGLVVVWVWFDRGLFAVKARTGKNAKKTRLPNPNPARRQLDLCKESFASNAQKA